MNIISNILSTKQKNSNCALIPFITAGFPDIKTTIEVLYTLDKNGADIIELGIPYADALADGPIIQHSSQVAISHGTYVDQVLTILQTTTKKLKAPIVLFTYYNPILVRGIDRFIEDIALSGAKGLIVPDLPIEETDYLIHLCNMHNVELILFIAPTSSDDRISNILSKSPGCLYIVSSTGVTGMRNHINSKIIQILEYVKLRTNKFIILGFGISNINQAQEISKWPIDGIVIGSAFIKILSDDNLHSLSKLKNFCSSIKNAITLTKNL